jgi:hypothetical protein
VGRPIGRRETCVHPPDGELRRLPGLCGRPDRATNRQHRAGRRAGQYAHLLGAWSVSIPDSPPLSIESTKSATRSPNRTFRSAGHGRCPLRSNGPSRSSATSTARATLWGSTGLTALRRRANSAPNSTTSSHRTDDPGSGSHCRAERRQRHRAEADGGRQHDVLLRRREREEPKVFVNKGVIVADGGLNGGWSPYVQEGKLTYHYNLADFEHSTVQAKDRVPTGKVTSKGLKPGGTLNSGATVKLFVNGTLTGEGTVGSAMVRQASSRSRSAAIQFPRSAQTTSRKAHSRSPARSRRSNSTRRRSLPRNEVNLSNSERILHYGCTDGDR